jgi:hypothetical protein
MSYEIGNQIPDYGTSSLSSPMAGFCISGVEPSGSATRQSKQYLWCNWVLVSVDTAAAATT